MTCELCEDRSWTVEPDGGSGTARPCSCRREPSVEVRMEAAGVPREFLAPRPYLGRRPDLSAFPGERHFLTLSGAAGRGKSRLAADIVRDWIAAGGKAAWREAEELLILAKSRFGSEDGTEGLLRPLLSPTLLLVLDEAWAEQNTDYNAGFISRLIRRRYRDLGPTIITTNLTESQVEKTEPRLHSRMWGSLVLTLGGPDFRRLDAATAARGR